VSVVTKALREAYKGVLHLNSQTARANNALFSLCRLGRLALEQGVVNPSFTRARRTRPLSFWSVWEAHLHGSYENHQYGTAAGVILQLRKSISDEGIVLLRPSLPVNWRCTCSHHQRMNKGARAL
jgi:hypothetical protein